MGHEAHGDIVAPGAIDQVGVKPVAVHQLPGHFPEHVAPEETDAVRLGDEGGIADVAVGPVVDVHVRGVGGRADAGSVGGLEDGISAHTTDVWALVAGLHGHHQAEPVGPAFAHLLGIVEAVGVGGASGEAGGDAVAVFVGDDHVVEVAIAVISDAGAAEGDVHGAAQVLLEQVAVAQRDHHGGDVDGGAGATHGDGAAGDVVADHAGNCSGILGILDLLDECAGAPVDEGDLVVEGCAIGEGVAAEAGVAGAVADEDEVACEWDGGDGWAKLRRDGLVAAGDLGGAVGDEVHSRLPGPEVHLHARAGAFGGGCKVGIVHAAAVLCVCEDVVCPSAACAVVVLLEVAAGCVEAVFGPDIVHAVVPVEEVGDGGVLVCAGIGIQVQREVEVQAAAAAGAVACAVIAIGILLGPDVVAAGDGVLSAVGTVGVVPSVGAVGCDPRG